MSTEDGGAAGQDLGRELSRAVVLFHQALAERVGLSAADLKTLELVQAEGPFSATGLADRTGLTQAGVTSLLARLVAGGHAVREVDPEDRRRAIIRASDSDHPELVAAFRRLGEALGGVIGDYAPAERAAIVSYLRRTVEILRNQTELLSKPDP